VSFSGHSVRVNVVAAPLPIFFEESVGFGEPHNRAKRTVPICIRGILPIEFTWGDNRM
jgi:hypothetical protein